MLPNNDLIMSNLATSANQTSKIQWSQKIVRASFQIVVTGSASAGSLQLQWSNDLAIGNFPWIFIPTNWTNLGTSVAVSGAAVLSIPLTELSYEYLQLIYTDTSSGAGNGVLNARMKSMGL